MRHESMFLPKVKTITASQLFTFGIKQFIALALCLFIINVGNTAIPNYLPPTPGSSTYSTAGTQTFTVPVGVTSITVSTWGGGGRGSTRTTSGIGGGGGGGAFSRHTLTVTPGQTITLNVGSGSSTTSKGGDSWASTTTVVGGAFVLAIGGNSAANNSATGAVGGSISTGIGALKYAGGNGATGSGTNAGGGGSSAGTGVNGNNGSGATGGIAPSGGGAGGNGRTGSHGVGLVGTAPGAGGGGSYWTSSGTTAGGNGAVGRVIIDYVRNETCGNGADDDGDGLTDCADPDCSTSVTLSTPIVSGCINQPLQDIATVSVIVTWSSAPAGGKLKIAHDNKIEIINVAGGAISPQTIVFNVVANGTTGNTITASWDLGTNCTAATSSAFTKPSACSSDQINCSILYLCGNAKPADGEAWDKGLMGYVMSQNGGTTVAGLTKTDASGYGIYDVMSPTTLLSINLDNYGMIIISSTTEGYVANGLLEALKGYRGSILNMNYLLVQSLGYSATGGYYNWQANAYTTVLEDILNYDNSYPSPSYGYLFTEGDFYSNADAFLWHSSAAKTSNLGGIYFSYDAHENGNISSTHGKRVYLGYHANGIYQNAQNGGAMPVPAANYFAPNRHLTTKGKELLDDAIKRAASCATEVCSNGTDDDGDGLVDCLDPSCNDILNGEFDNGTTNWNLFVQGGAVSTMSVDATNQLSGSNSMRIITTTTNGTEWNVQLAQSGESLVAGKTYKVSFKAKASAARNASVSLGLGISPYTSYFYQIFALTTTSQNYSFEFTASTSISNNVNLLFNLAAVNGTVWIDQVEFKEICPPPTLSCGALCPSQNKLINGSFDTNVSGWTSPTGVVELGNSNTSTIMILNNADAAGPFTVYQDYIIGANQQFFFTGLTARHANTANAKVYLEYYNGTTYLSKTADFNVTKVFDGTFQSITPILAFTPANTTKIRVVGWCAGTAIKFDDLSITICQSCAEICTNGIDDDGDGLIDCADTDCIPLVANAGVDQTQCMNGAFTLIANNPSAGQTGLWSIVSGTPLITAPLNNDSISVSLQSGQTARLRWTISKGGCTSTDDVIITNTTGCSTVCVDAINRNGDLETEGTATNFNLTFQGTPALLMNNGVSPEGWGPLYGSSVTNTTTFQGAYYIKKTGAEGNPHSGTHMIYSGGDFCFTPYYTNINISCGKTYKISLWAAAYTNGPTQLSSPFDIEFAAGSSSLPMPYKPKLSLNAPASTSWNVLNWQRYEMTVTIPSGTAFEYANFYITTSNATRGLVVDDVCITEVSSGSDARAGADQYGCSNVFTLAANTPPAGYTGAWTVLSGTASLSSTTAPNATATITAGTSATLAWTVTSGVSCSDVDNVVIGFANNTLSVNNQSICAGSSATLTATGCTGSLLWSNGATTGNISVSPASTTTYNVTCTPTSSANLSLNGGFESATNMQDWVSWGGTYGVTTVPSEIRTGSKAAKIDGTTLWGGFAQSIAAVPGEFYTIKFWAKSNNTNAEPLMQFRFLNSAYVGLVNWSNIPITSTIYQEYTITTVSPLNTSFLEYAFSVGTISILFIDDVTITKVNGCVRNASGTVTVNALPTIVSTIPGSICGASGTVVLGATASAGTINWYAASTGGVSLGTGTSFTTPSISATTTYYVDATNSGCTSARTAVVATVNAVPTIASSTPASRCGTGTVILGATASAGTLNWYAASTGGSSLFTGGSFTTPSISATTTYYVDATNSGCTSARTAVVATVNAVPTIASSTPASRCGTGTVILGATASAGTLNWYAASTGGSSLFTGSSFNTPSISASTTYYVETSNGGCTSARTSVVATINAVPTASISGNNFTCNSGVSTTGSDFYALADNSNNPQLYKITQNGTSTLVGALGISQDVEAMEMNKIGTKIYGVASQGGSAALAKLGFISITTGAWTEIGNIGNTAGPTVIEPKEIDAISFDNSGNLWAISNEPISSILFKIDTLTGSIVRNTFGAGLDYVQLTGSAATINVEAIAYDAVENKFYLAGWSSGPNAGLYSLNVSTGSTALVFDFVHCNEDIEGLEITLDGKMFASSGNGGNGGPDNSACFNKLYSVNKLTGVLTELSTISTVHNDFEALTAPGVPTTLVTASGGSTYLWSNSSTIATIAAIAGSYVVTVTAANGCTSSASHIVTSTTIVPSVTGSNNICVGGTSTLSPTTGGVWTSSNTSVATVTSGGVVTGIASGTVTFTFTNSVTNCISNPTLPITVTSIPTIISTTPGSICAASGTVTLGATASAGTINWYNVATGGSSIGVGTFYPTPIINANTTYYVQSTSNGCTTSSRTAVLASVNTGPTIISSTPASRCGSGTVILGATASAGTLNWYAASTGGATLGTGTSYTTPSLSATTSYFVDATNVGCTSARSEVVATINTTPTILTSTPGSICGASGTVVLGATASAGTINWYAASTGGLSLGTGTAFTTPSISANTTYYVDATSAGCTTSSRTSVLASVNTGPVILTTTPGSRCGSGVVNLSATASAATINWFAASTGGSSLFSGGSFTTPSISANTTYYVETSNGGCTSSRTAVVATINPIPGTKIISSASRCGPGSVTLSVLFGSGNSFWYDAPTGGNLVAGPTNSFTTPSLNSTTTYYIEGELNGCISASRQAITATINPILTASINFNGSVCLTPTSQLSGVPAGGTGPFTYSWTGPSGFSSDVQTISINTNGNYNLTITDSKGCSAATTGFVYTAFEPLIVSLQTTVCQGESVNLNVSAANVTSYLWGANAGNATTSNVTVTPSIPSTAYNVTVTNNVGCAGVATATINVTPRPTTSISGPTPICVGQTSQMTSNSTGTWVSNNPSVATINASGLVTGVGVGSSTFTVTNTPSTCNSLASAPIAVNAKPNAGPDLTPLQCNTTDVATMQGTGTGTWTLGTNSTGTAVINNTTSPTTTVATFSAPGNYYLVWTNVSGCKDTALVVVSDACSCPIANNDIYQPSNAVVCGSFGPVVIDGASATPQPGVYLWEYSINNGAYNPAPGTNTNRTYTTSVLGVGEHKFRRRFTKTNGTICSTSSNAITITVNANPTINSLPSSALCVGEVVSLTAVQAGTWISNNPGIASISSGGLVTGLSSGNATFTFTQSGTGCSSTTGAVTVKSKPTINSFANTALCLGEQLQLTASTTGTWSSSNNPVATISSTGLITAVGIGQFDITFTAANGCSTTTINLDVLTKPGTSYSGLPEVCVGSNKQLLPSSGGTWTGFDLTKATITSSGVITGLSAGQARFVYKLGGTSCPSDTVYITINPSTSLSINFNGSQCFNAGMQVTALGSNGTPSYSYNWTGPSSFTSTSPTIIVPVNGNYAVTVIDSKGCTASTTGFVYQEYSPFVVNLNTDVCEGTSVNLSVNASGTPTYLWSANASNATTQSVSVIPSFPSSTYQVTVTNNIGCTAVATSIISVKAKPIITINGAPNICIGGSVQLTSSATGTWANSNPGVASISSTGLVTGLSNGSATFIFTASNSCISDPTTPINVNGSIPISNLGSNALCIGGTTQLSPSTGGTWTSSNPSIATVNNAGLVTAIANGFVSFSFVNSGSGCSSNGSLNVFINAKPSTLIIGDASICPSSTTTLWPSTGGTWVSNNPSVATINNSGIVTGVSQGSATFVFTETSNGCPSDNTSPITVKAIPVITLSGASPICAGSTTAFTTSDPGQWVSSNSAIAIINNSGLVTGMQQGTATFLFTSNVSQCASLPSAGITVNGRPTVSITGPSSICIGSNTQMSPTTGGTWVSTNPSVATINNSGLVLGVSTGTVRFIFTNTSTGCISNQSGEVLIYSRPTISVSGPTQICIGGTTNMLPATGGSWTSSNIALANISNTGLVTAIALGTVTFTYTESGSSCVSNASVPIIITNKPIVSISGANPICIGANTNLSPSIGGSWISNNPSVATVTGSGLVTSISSGLVTFTFTTTNGCVSDATSPLIVNGKPITSINGPSAICIGSTTQLTPSIGGTWTSGSNLIATVTNTGLVSGVAQGVVRFSYVDNVTGCKSDSTTLVTVLNATDPVINGANNICIGSNTQLSPTVGGIWLSSNPAIANISNSGLVTGLSAGSATFTFSNATTGCISNASAPIIVNAKPIVGVTGPTVLCIGQTSQVIPTTGGTWISLNPTIASVNNQGEVIALSQGVARFQFTNTSGCTATTALPIIVNGTPQVSLNGIDEICIGGTTQLLPSSGGTWSSNNISIASINNSGLVTGLSAGKATFKYIESSTGCEAQFQDTIVVKSPINISVVGLSSICIGLTTQLSPSSGGIWMSSNSSIASVNNNGVVKGLAGGKVTFSFIEAVTGCTSYLPADAIHVVNCIDPDVNIHFVSSPVNGSVATNDDGNMAFLYNNYLPIDKPLGATTSFTLQANGSYTFVGDKAGKYIYKIYVCQGVMGTDCSASYLTIDLLERNTGKNIAANTDFLTIYPTNMTTNYLINVISNDGCINSGNCTLDSLTMVITDQPNHGTAFVNFDGTIRYQHTSNFIGFDTIVYRICENGNPLSCDEASVILMIGQSSAPNSTVAVDDFYSRKKGESIIGNILMNDTDPEGNSISVVAHGSSTSPIVTAFGSYFISSLGEFNFTPNSEYSGASQIIYTICDNHTQTKCTKATIYLLYQDDLKLKIRGYIQGSIVENGNQYSSTGKPLMRDNLRMSPHTGLNYIPGRDPYTHPSKFINIGSVYTKVGPGLLPSNQVIADSTAVFAVSGENAIVDWVFIELRDQSDNTKIIATRSGLIQRDGDIVDLDGISDLKFNGVSEDSLYIVFKHRSHLAAMTNKIGVKGLHDFSNNSTPIHSYGTTYASGIDFTNVIQANISSQNVKALWSGDMNCDGRLKFSNPFDDQNSLFFDVVTYPGNDQGSANYNFAYGYLQGDIDMDSKAKYDNPDDDKNLLFSQMVSNPLNVGFLANFNYFIQQVPVGTPK